MLKSAVEHKNADSFFFFLSCFAFKSSLNRLESSWILHDRIFCYLPHFCQFNSLYIALMFVFSWNARKLQLFMFCIFGIKSSISLFLAFIVVFLELNMNFDYFSFSHVNFLSVLYIASRPRYVWYVLLSVSTTNKVGSIYQVVSNQKRLIL